MIRSSNSTCPSYSARDVPAHVQEETLRVLEDVRLVREGDLPPRVSYRVLERVPDDPLRAESGDDHDRLGRRPGVVLESDVVLHPHVEAFCVPADQNQTDGLVALPRYQRDRGSHVCVEVELLPDGDVDGAEARARGGRERTLERNGGAPDRLEGLRR